MPVWKKIAFPLLSGLLIALLFPKYDQFYLAWVALVPLLLLLYTTDDLKTALTGGLMCGLFFSGILFYWTGLFGLLAWTSMTVYSSLVYLVFSTGVFWLKERLPFSIRVLVIPAWMVTIELIRSVGWWGFSWGNLGYSQQLDSNMMIAAQVFGVYGLTYIIVLVNVLLTEILIDQSRKAGIQPSFRQKRSNIVLLSSIVFIYLALTGIRAIAGRQSEEEGRVKVAVLQGNIPQKDKFDERKEEEIKAAYLKMTEKAVKAGSRLVIWPETSYPGYLQEDQAFSEEIQEISDRYQTDVIVGSFYYEERTDHYYNAAYLFRPHHQKMRYDKVNLVPFGEYVPFRPLFGRIKALEPIQVDSTAAKDIVLLGKGKEKIGLGICFESSNSLLVREMVARGASLLIFITNDAWFKQTAAPYQHLQTTVLRAAENDVYVIQAANTGISAFVGPGGRIMEKKKLGTTGILYGNIDHASQVSSFSRWGYLFPYLTLLVSLCAFIYAAAVPQKQNHLKY